VSETAGSDPYAALLERARALAAEKRASGDIPEGTTGALDRLFMEVAPPGARVEGEGMAGAVEMLARFRFDPIVEVETRRARFGGVVRLVKRGLSPIVAWQLRHLTHQLNAYHAAEVEILRALVEAAGRERGEPPHPESAPGAYPER
jgi:hypothetical protein